MTQPAVDSLEAEQEQLRSKYGIDDADDDATDEDGTNYGKARDFVLFELPCQDCRKVKTLMGSPCDECIAAERERNREQRVRAGTHALLHALKPWPWAVVGSPEFRSRVRHPKLRAFAERYQPEKGSVLIVGESGVGKTVSKASCARRLVAEALAGRSNDSPIVGAMWITAIDLAVDGREQRFGSRDELLHAVHSAPLLFLDELGQERADPRWLLEAIEPRYFRQRPTITTSGLRRAELEARYGTGAVRRLIEPVGHCLDLFGGPA